MILLFFGKYSLEIRLAEGGHREKKLHGGGIIFT